MAQVQYITREFIPRVDLTTLGNTFNTLEQGHQAAIQAASDLKATIATLPMDAQEDGFKEKLVNEINQTVDDNTLYGNSYGEYYNGQRNLDKKWYIQYDSDHYSGYFARRNYKEYQSIKDAYEDIHPLERRRYLANGNLYSIYW